MYVAPLSLSLCLYTRQELHLHISRGIRRMDRQTDEWMDRWTDKHKMHKVEWTYILTYIHTYKWVYQLVRLSVVLTFYRMLLISHCVLYEGMFVFQLRPRHSTTNSTIAMWRVCVSLWYAHTKLYTLLDVVMYVFLCCWEGFLVL